MIVQCSNIVSMTDLEWPSYCNAYQAMYECIIWLGLQANCVSAFIVMLRPPLSCLYALAALRVFYGSNRVDRCKNAFV